MNFGDFKVVVTGGTKKRQEAEAASKPVKKAQHIEVDMRKNVAYPEKPDYEKNLINMIQSIMCSSVDKQLKSHLIMMEIKRIYIESIKDEHFDVDANQYLDETVFNGIEDIIKSFITKDNFDLYAIVMGTIENSVISLDYKDVFNYEKMQATLKTIVTTLQSIV